MKVWDDFLKEKPSLFRIGQSAGNGEDDDDDDDDDNTTTTVLAAHHVLPHFTLFPLSKEPAVYL